MLRLIPIHSFIGYVVENHICQYTYLFSMGKEKWYVLSLCVLALVMVAPLFMTEHIEMADWYQLMSFYRSAHDTLLNYGQIPFWSPYFGGGIFMLGHPQDISLSPLFFTILLFGEVLGTKLNMALLFVFGALGMYRLLKDEYMLSSIQAFTASACYVSSGWFISRMAEGTIDYEMFYLLLPLVAWLVFKSKDKKVWLVAAVLLIWTILLTGAFVFVCITGLVLALNLLRKGRRLHVLLILLLVMGLGAVKLFPMSELLEQSSGCVNDYSPKPGACQYEYALVKERQVSLTQLLHNLLHYTPYVHHNIYLGILPSVLVTIGIVLGWKSMRVEGLLLVALIVLLMGHHFFIDFYRLLWELPIVHDIVRIDKYLSPLILFLLCIFLAKGMPRKTGVAIPILFLAVLPLMVVTLQTPFAQGELESSTQDIHTHMQIENVSSRNTLSVAKLQYANIAAEVGTLNWYSSIMPSVSAVKGPITDAHIISFTPNQISLQGTDKVLNMNYNKNWKASCGELYDAGGLLGIRAKICKETELTFSPRSFYIGLAISLISMLALIQISYMKVLRK